MRIFPDFPWERHGLGALIAYPPTDQAVGQPDGLASLKRHRRHRQKSGASKGGLMNVAIVVFAVKRRLIDRRL
jgi:hypothetical protein